MVKVGGSLFSLRHLSKALQQWLDENSDVGTVNVLIAGGGAFADAIRQADELHELGAETSHWLCVDLLSESAKLLAALMPTTTIVDRADTIRSFQGGMRRIDVVFDPARFMRDEEPRLGGFSLPRDWGTTSDSIAGRLAAFLRTDELVLMKSTDANVLDRSEAIAQGLVDPHFADATQSLRKVRWVNLRTGHESLLP